MESAIIARRYIDALVPGGIPDREQRVQLVVDLLSLAGEHPEVDVEAAGEILVRAARVVFADGLALADADLPVKLEIDKLVREYSLEMDEAEGRAVTGARTPEWYSGVMEGLQLVRKALIGSYLQTNRTA